MMNRRRIIICEECVREADLFITIPLLSFSFLFIFLAHVATEIDFRWSLNDNFLARLARRQQGDRLP